MNNLIKKPWFLRTVVLVSLSLVFLFDLLVLLLPFRGVYQAYSVWSLADATSAGDETIFPLCLKILFFVSLLPLAFSVADLARKKNWGNAIAASYFLLEEAAFLLYQAVKGYLSVGAVVLLVFALLLVILAFFALFKEIEINAIPEKEQAGTNGIGDKKLSLILLILSTLSLLTLFLSLLNVPLFTYTNNSLTTTVVFAQLLSANNNTGENAIYFIVNVLLFFGVFLYAIFALNHYWNAKKSFIAETKTLLILELGLSFEFFLLGFIIQYVYNLKGVVSSSIAFVPFILMMLFALAYAIIQGRFGERSVSLPKTEKPKNAPRRFEPLFFVLLTSIVTVISLWLNIVNIHFSYSNVSSSAQLTTLKLLQDYGTLGKGYQSLAFGVVTMFIISGIGLFLSSAAFFSHSKAYVTIAKWAIYANIFLIFLFGISGIYFSIATEINVDSTKEIIESQYGQTITGELKYTIQTDIFYLLIADVVLSLVMVFRKSLEKKNEPEAAFAENENALATPTLTKKSIPSESLANPCPAFSELDAKEEDFKKDLESRKSLLVTNPSLPGLVRFVVDYARDSRLHLSYSLEDMADFVAGLGACRLSILQGMSGTGKTSLPKIFTEAIDGDCDLVEVESSWKDKNELLGYYNEFSEKYTPKKFTQALYKAAMNPEITTFIVLDEMNLSRIEYYFSDFLSLMENEESQRSIKLLNVAISNQGMPYKALKEGEILKVPANVFFIGTANRDESTFVISDKVYDRAHTMNFNRRAPKVRDFQEPMAPSFYPYEVLASLFENAKKNGRFDAENNLLIQQSETLLAPYNLSFGNRILKQMEDYVVLYEACFPERNVESEAVERILLSKVVSKLETKTIEDKEALADSFREIRLEKCADFIDKLNED